MVWRRPGPGPRRCWGSALRGFHAAPRRWAGRPPGMCTVLPSRGRASRTVSAVTVRRGAASPLQDAGSARGNRGAEREFGRQQDQEPIVRPNLRRSCRGWRGDAHQRVQEAALLLLFGEVQARVREGRRTHPDAGSGAGGRALHARQGQVGAGLGRRGGGVRRRPALAGSIFLEWSTAKRGPPGCGSRFAVVYVRTSFSFSWRRSSPFQLSTPS